MCIFPGVDDGPEKWHFFGFKKIRLFFQQTQYPWNRCFCFPASNTGSALNGKFSPLFIWQNSSNMSISLEGRKPEVLLTVWIWNQKNMRYTQHPGKNKVWQIFHPGVAAWHHKTAFSFAWSTSKPKPPAGAWPELQAVQGQGRNLTWSPSMQVHSFLG